MSSWQSFSRHSWQSCILKKNSKNKGKNWQKTEFLLQLLLLSPTHQTLESFYTSAVFTTLPLLCDAPTLTRTHTQTSHHLHPAALIATEIRSTGASARGSSVRGCCLDSPCGWTAIRTNSCINLRAAFHTKKKGKKKYIERGNSKWRWKTENPIWKICSNLWCLESARILLWCGRLSASEPGAEQC